MTVPMIILAVGSVVAGFLLVNGARAELAGPVGRPDAEEAGARRSRR